MTNSKDISNNNVLIIALVALAAVVIAAIVALAIFGSPDNAVVGSAIGQIVTLVTLIAGVLVTLKVTTEAKVAAVESIAASKDNAQTLAVTSTQQAHALEEQSQTLKQVDRKVDGHLGKIMLEMQMMAKQIASLETDKAVKASETSQLLGAMAATIPAPSTGATTPHGTPIGGGTPDDAATVITIDPAEAATITSVPLKGKRPKVGDHQ